MNQQTYGRFQGVMDILVRVSSGLAILLAFMVTIPLTLWFTWRHPASTFAYPAVVTLFCLSFAWATVSMLQMQRSLRKLGLSSSDRMRIFSGPRPDDPDELCAWKWAWQFLYAVLAGVLSMIAIPMTAWLAGK